MAHLLVPAKKDLIDSMIDPILDSLKEVEASGKVIYQLHLTLEEIFVNIVNYAYDEEGGNVDISYHLDIENRNVKITITDKGKEFDPLKVEEPSFEGTAKERKIGGLGIYIVKNLVDDIEYHRFNNQNVLEITKNY